MNTYILTTADPRWNAYLSRLPGSDVYHTAEYHRAHEVNGDGTALCFVAEDGDNLLVHPMMQQTIADYGYGQWMDLESVYGYSGPLAWVENISFLSLAWKQYHELCRDTHQVAEFVRFNPISENSDRYCYGHSSIYLERSTVVLDLSGTPDDLLARGEKRHRGRVRRAPKEGLIAAEAPRICGMVAGWQQFIRLYQETMKRNQATDYYSWGDAYFEALATHLGDHSKLFLVVQKGGQIVASAIFLLYRDRMHYHLAGSDPDYPGYGDNNLLLHTAALWGQEHGYRWLHLGGGRTAAPDDSLLRFKASVSRERRPFYTGHRIHNPEAYDRLCADWMRQHRVTERPDYFLLWRKP